MNPKFKITSINNVEYDTEWERRAFEAICSFWHKPYEGLDFEFSFSDLEDRFEIVKEDIWPSFQKWSKCTIERKVEEITQSFCPLQSCLIDNEKEIIRFSLDPILRSDWE